MFFPVCPEKSNGFQWAVSSIFSAIILLIFSFHSLFPMLGPQFPDFHSLCSFLTQSCFDGWSISSNSFLRKTVLKVKLLNCCISENYFILFYTQWIVFIDIEFLLEVLTPQHLDGIFHCFLIAILAIEKSDAVLNLDPLDVNFFSNLMLLASSYYPWNLKFQNDVPWCRSFLINCMEEVNGSFFSGGLFFSSGNFSCINNFITSKVNFLFDLTI